LSPKSPPNAFLSPNESKKADKLSVNNIGEDLEVFNIEAEKLRKSSSKQ
jgi:hypothetical protein